MAKFEFKVTVHYSLWENVPICDPLNIGSEILEIKFGQIIKLFLQTVC